jgi:hypothetical protein
MGFAAVLLFFLLELIPLGFKDSKTFYLTGQVLGLKY